MIGLRSIRPSLAVAASCRLKNYSAGIGALLLVALAVQAPAQTPQPAVLHPSPLDAARVIADVEVFSADSMEGRRTGTAGNERARRYLLRAFAEIGLTPFGTSYERRFAFRPRGVAADLRGVNIVGWIRGSRYPDRYIVVTAHYDHLGTEDGSIYHGADDNASGTAGLLALARYFRAQPPAHSLVFAAMDAEERGLSGARAFVADPPVDREAIVFNVNLDMISRNERDELYVAGTYHYPRLSPLVRRLADTAPVTLLAGHDRPDLAPGDDWTRASDHGAFHDAGIPFLYFGVEDHEDYHRPTDTFENIDTDFLVRAVETVRRAVAALDAELGSIPDL